MSAVDASGRGLRAWLGLRGGRLSVFVDDRAARYPLRVDPFVQQGAKLVETAQDVLEELPELARRTVVVSRTGKAGTESDGDALLKALGFEPASLDALVARTGTPASVLQARLLELELAGLVARLQGGLFQRTGTA